MTRFPLHKPNLNNPIRPVKIKDWIIIALVGVVAFLLLMQECQPKPEPVIEKRTEVDTFFIPGKDSIHELRVPYPVPYAVHDSIPVWQKVDTAAILADYFKKRFYSDSAYNDSVRVYYAAQVYKNSLIDMKLKYRLTLPQMVIKESTTVTETVNRQLAFVGVDLTSNGQNLGFYPSIYFDTKGAMFGGGFDPLSKSLKVGVYKKIKLWKRN